jgi:SAM-dependent methyltransferase
MAIHGYVKVTRMLGRELWDFVRDSTPARRRQRYGDIDYDWDHRVDTTGATVSWRDRLLGVLHSPYQPTQPALFREMLDNLPIDFSAFVFVDLGSGKGRTLLMASDYPFKRIIGVELLPALHHIAQENLSKYNSNTQRCFDIVVMCQDARDFEFPPEPTLLYLFNPLPYPGLKRVIEKLEHSVRQHPRAVYVVYHNPLLEDVLARSKAWEKIGGTHQWVSYKATE